MCTWCVECRNAITLVTFSLSFPLFPSLSLFSPLLHPNPNPNPNGCTDLYQAFETLVKECVEESGNTWDPMRKRQCPWVNIRALRQIYVHQVRERGEKGETRVHVYMCAVLLCAVFLMLTHMLRSPSLSLFLRPTSHQGGELRSSAHAPLESPPPSRGQQAGGYGGYGGGYGGEGKAGGGEESGSRREGRMRPKRSSGGSSTMSAGGSSSFDLGSSAGGGGGGGGGGTPATPAELKRARMNAYVNGFIVMFKSLVCFK
jgi:hypothetical protein